MLRPLAILHGAYFFITGIWPILNIGSFMAVTGPKTDIWLVKMVGALTVSISLLLIISGIRKKITPESFVLIIASCLSYLLIDVVYVLNHTIRPIYLADAFVEVVLVALWIMWKVENSKTKS